jgi:hypothetical protein
VNKKSAAGGEQINLKLKEGTMFQNHRMELIKLALAGLLSNETAWENTARYARKMGLDQFDIVAGNAIVIADAVIKKLEEEGEEKG